MLWISCHWLPEQVDIDGFHQRSDEIRPTEEVFDSDHDESESRDYVECEMSTLRDLMGMRVFLLVERERQEKENESGIAQHC
jgi:hypothetical protein